MQLTPNQKSFVLARAEALVLQAQKQWLFPNPKVVFNFRTRGSAAGKAKFHPDRSIEISFNEAVFAADFDHHLQDTIAHEVAHLVCFLRYGAKVKPHGLEWKQVAVSLGALPKATGRYSLEGVSVHRHPRILFRCRCREHGITTRRVNKIARGAIYLCKFCGEKIRPAS